MESEMASNEQGGGEGAPWGAVGGGDPDRTAEGRTGPRLRPQFHD